MRSNIKTTLFAAGLGAIAMTVSASAANKVSVPSGAWGGDRMNMMMNATGATIDMDCASGVITGKIKPDAKGRFTARGTFDQQRGGPQRADDFVAGGKPAIYSGQFAGRTLKLSVTPAGATAPQNYVLQQGQRVKLVRCY